MAFHHVMFAQNIPEKPNQSKKKTQRQREKTRCSECVTKKKKKTRKAIKKKEKEAVCKYHDTMLSGDTLNIYICPRVVRRRHLHQVLNSTTA